MGRRRKARNRTRVFIVQDKSGSMGSRREATISGFNEYVDELDNKAEGDIRLSLFQFDTRVDTKFLDRRIEDVDDLTEEDFVPGGMTALLDGVGHAIRKAEDVVTSGDKVLMVIMTDGGENSSREYAHAHLLNKMQAKRKDGWEFIFLGAGEEAWGAGQKFFRSVIPEANTINYSSFNAHDHQATYAALASSTISVSRGGASGFEPMVKRRLESKAKAEVKK